MSRREELTTARRVPAAARAHVSLAEVDDLAEARASRARKAVAVLLAAGAFVAPTAWAASAFAHDAEQPAATLAKGSGTGGDDDEDNSGPGGGDDDEDDSGPSGTGIGGATDQGNDTSAANDDTAGTTAGTGASQTDTGTGKGGATDRGGDTSANGDDTAGTTAGTGASATSTQG